MEQIYSIEMFIDKVTIFASEEDETSGANKNLIIKLGFGPKLHFTVKEEPSQEKKDDIIECDEHGRRKWTKIIRVGKSYLFPSYPDTVLSTLSNFPLEIEVWNDDENEVGIFVGIGSMSWDKRFFNMLKETTDAGKLHEPLTLKQVTPLFAECCCRQCGEISFILRVSALGESIITEFQELTNDPENAFVFRTDKTPNMFRCKRVNGDDVNFCMVGSLYETTTLEDPDVVNNAQKKIEVYTELQSCGTGLTNEDYTCENKAEGEEQPKKQYDIEKIKMGEITGPCGNFNCPLAHKVRTYIRNLNSYKEVASNVTGVKTDAAAKKVCGKCICKNDQYHRDECPEKLEQKAQETSKEKAKCSACGGITTLGHTCEDKMKKMQESPATSQSPKSDKTKGRSPSPSPTGGSNTVNYVLNTTGFPTFKVSAHGKDFTIQSLETDMNYTYYDKFGCSYYCNDLETASGEISDNLLTSFSNIDLKCKNSAYERDFTVQNVELNGKNIKQFGNFGGFCGCSRQKPPIKQTSNKPNIESNISRYGKEFTVIGLEENINNYVTNDNNRGGCCCSRQMAPKELSNVISNPNMKLAENISTRSLGVNSPMVYNMELKDSRRKVSVYNCTEIPDDKDCKCDPPKPTPPCNTFDCECATETAKIAARKAHKPYCPSYKHKNNCPVTMKYLEEENKDDDEDETEPLPYGLPPIKLGPCPVMGRPCSIPDGFARMYKAGVQAALPASYSEAGKVCCSREFERIKKAIQDYMKNEKEDDNRCINKFYVDTERRCCDNEQKLMSMIGKSCCGSHKSALADKYKE